MATVDAIADVIDLFIDAPLQFMPRDTEKTGELWLTAFRDIPDAILKQAAADYIARETDWPPPAKLRAVAEKVKSNNGASIAGGQFKPIPEQHIIWQPSGVPRVVFPPDVMKAIQALEEKYYNSGLPTDAEMAEIQRLTAPHKEALCTAS